MCVCVCVYTYYVYLKIQLLPSSEHSHLNTGVDKLSVETQLAFSLSVIQTSQLMLYSKTIAVCSEIHTKHK